jgi:hypothetical protein
VSVVTSESTGPKGKCVATTHKNDASIRIPNIVPEYSRLDLHVAICGMYTPPIGGSIAGERGVSDSKIALG